MELVYGYVNFNGNSVYRGRKDGIRNTVYEKLFNASDGYWADETNPFFSAPELDMLKMIMQNGIDLLLNNISIIENEIILP